MQNSDRLLQYLVAENGKIVGRDARSPQIAEKLYQRLRKDFKGELALFLNEAADVQSLQGLRGTLFEQAMKDSLQQEMKLRSRNLNEPGDCNALDCDSDLAVPGTNIVQDQTSKFCWKEYHINNYIYASSNSSTAITSLDRCNALVTSLLKSS